MFHPDQCYDLRALQHQDLQMEAAHMRLAAQARGARNHRLTHAATTMRMLARRLVMSLRLLPITHTPASRR